MRTLIIAALCCIAATFAATASEQVALSTGVLDARFTDFSLAVQIAILTVTTFAGVIAHFLKLWREGEIAGNLIDYLVRDNPRATVAALMGAYGAVAGAYLMGQFGDAHSLVTLKQVLMPVFLAGYVGDSALNKSAPTHPDVAPHQ